MNRQWIEPIVLPCVLMLFGMPFFWLAYGVNSWFSCIFIPIIGVTRQKEECIHPFEDSKLKVKEGLSKYKESLYP